MIYGKASLGFLTDDELEILWHDTRDLKLMARACGVFALGHHLGMFEADQVVEISRRAAAQRMQPEPQLQFLKLEDVTASSAIDTPAPLGEPPHPA